MLSPMLLPTFCSPQAFASLKALQPQIDKIHKNAEDWDVPTPVLDALRSLLIGKNSQARPVAMTDTPLPPITK